MTSIERSWSSRLFSPTSHKVADHFPRANDALEDKDGFTSVGNGPGGGLHSSLRRRSQSQNQLRRTLDNAASPSRPLFDNPSVAPLRLKNLPLASFSVASSSSPLKSSGRPVQLAPLKRITLHFRGVNAAAGNQEESTFNEPEERASTMTTVSSEDPDNQLDHQLISLSQEKKSVFLNETPDASPRETAFLPRLATLDLKGDARYLMRHSSSSSSSSSSTAVSPRMRNWTKLERVCDEIVTTERSYVRDLRILLRHFFTPLQEYAIKYTIPLGAISALHASIRTILHIHNELLRQIASAVNRPSDVDSWSTNEGRVAAEEDNESEAQEDDDENDWLGTTLTASTLGGHEADLTNSRASVASVSQVAHAFDFTIEFMKVYALYCSSYLSAKDELTMLQKKYPGLNALTTQLDDHARRNLRVDIVSIMIKPVQRICRYPLLFRELLKHAVSSDQAEVVESTLRKIEGVSAHVNEKVREAQNNARLYELHQTIDPKAKIDLLQPSRTLLSEMLVRVVSLDAPCWPSFLLSLGRRRPWRSGEHSEGSLRRDSVLEPALIPLLSPQSPHSNGSCTYQSSTGSTSSATSSMRPPLLRRSSSGEKLRLILLSDVLLMAKKQEEKLKIKRQFCLSCANVVENSTTSAKPWSFVMEVAKVGRCNCHQLTPVTLKRSPKRRSSLSLSLSPDLLLGSLQTKQSPQPTTASPKHKSSGFFRGSEFASPLFFRSAKRYSVVCESEQKKTEFLAILQSAIARCARVQPAKATFPASVCEAAKLPGRFWRSLKPPQPPPRTISKSPSEQNLGQEEKNSNALALKSSGDDSGGHQLGMNEDLRAQISVSLV